MADENEALAREHFESDRWAYQQLGLEPDLVAFGKKTQVCGVMAGRRLDEIDDHVLRV